MVLSVLNPQRLILLRPPRSFGYSIKPQLHPLYSIGLLVAINTNGNKAETQRSKSNGEQYKEVYRIVGKSRRNAVKTDMYGVGGVSSIQGE